MCKYVKEHGALDIYCAATHGVFQKCFAKIGESGVKEFIVTNSIERSEEELAKVPNIKVLSIALLLAKGWLFHVISLFLMFINYSIQMKNKR